jgi:hypothetical protein
MTMISQPWPRAHAQDAAAYAPIVVHPAVSVVHPSDELARLDAEMSAEYVDACIDLNAHIRSCPFVCGLGGGVALCDVGEQIAGRMLDALGFDDDLNEWDRLEAMEQ